MKKRIIKKGNAQDEGGRERERVRADVPTEIKRQMTEIGRSDNSKLVRMVGRRCYKVGRRTRVQDAGGE